MSGLRDHWEAREGFEAMLEGQTGGKIVFTV
jgi:hypothetical protein